MKSWLSRAGLAVALVAGGVCPVRAQTFQVIHDFDGSDGAQPAAALISAQGALWGTTAEGGLHNLGTVFRRDPDGTVTTVLHFDGANGAQPRAALLLGEDGDFYGTTFTGGANGQGTIFRMTPSGDLTILHSFDGGFGRNPSAPLIQTDNGDFYGTARHGGTGLCEGGCGAVFKMDSFDNVSLVHDFNGLDGGYPFGALLEDDGGALWGTTFGFSDASGFSLGTVFRITPPTGFATIHTFLGEHEGEHPAGALILASDGNFYGTVYSGLQAESLILGGPPETGGIFRVTPAGDVSTLVAFDPNILLLPRAGLLQASDGFLYGTTQQSPTGSGTVFRSTIGGAVTVLHDFNETDGANPAEATLVEAADGNLYGTVAAGGSHSKGVIFRILIVSGGPLFCPNNFVRRDQMSVFLLKTIHDTAFDPPDCVGNFDDVDCPSLFADWIEALADEGVTAGCGGNDFCPLAAVRRDQMAVFLLKAGHGSAFTPPACAGDFPDVACPSLFADWVEALADEGISAGCGGGFFCPSAPVTRAQMAVFLLKVEHGPAYVPPACQALFGDVICPSFFADWIEQLYNEGITAGCSGVSP